MAILHSTPTISEIEPLLKAKRPWYQRLWKLCLEDPRFFCGLALLILILLAILVPWISPYDPIAKDTSVIAKDPSWQHWLGTDTLGRDQLTRVLYGARISLSVALLTILLAGTVGTLLGVLAAYFKGWVDQVITMICDAILSFPSLILVFALASALGSGLQNMVFALAFVRIPLYMRIARGQTLQIVEQDYINAAIVVGTRTWKILLYHVIPNIVSAVLVQATTSISFAIMEESILSYLGLGVLPPTPEWGFMIREAQPSLLGGSPWMTFGPVLVITGVLICFNLLGDALRDRLDPRDRGRFANVVAGKEKDAK